MENSDIRGRASELPGSRRRRVRRVRTTTVLRLNRCKYGSASLRIDTRSNAEKPVVGVVGVGVGVVGVCAGATTLRRCGMWLAELAADRRNARARGRQADTDDVDVWADARIERICVEVAFRGLSTLDSRKSQASREKRHKILPTISLLHSG